MRHTAPLLVLLVLAAAAASATAAAAASSSGRPRKALRAIGHAGAGTTLRSAVSTTSAASASSVSAPAVTGAAKPVPVHMATVVRLAPNTKGVNKARTLAAEGEQLGAIMGTVSAVTAATKRSGSRARKAAKRTARVAAASMQEDTEAYDDAAAASEDAVLEEQLGQMLTGINLRVAAAEAVVAGYSDEDGSELTGEEQDAEFAQLMADILARVAAVQDVMENAGLAGLGPDEERTALERDDASWSAEVDARRSVFVQHPAAKHQAQEAAVAEQEEEEEEGVADADIVDALQEQQEDAGDAAIADEEGEEEERADAAAALDASAADAADEEAEEQAAQRQEAISAKLELLSHLLAGLSAAEAQR